MTSHHASLSSQRSAVVAYLFATIARVAGALFVLAGFQTLFAPQEVAGVLRFDGVPAAWSVPLARTIASAQLGLGTALVLLGNQRTLVWVTIALLAIFCIQLGVLIFASEPPNCGCPGLLARTQSTRMEAGLSLLRNVMLMVLLACCVWRPRSGSREAETIGRI